jgi:hypothetical protein
MAAWSDDRDAAIASAQRADHAFTQAERLRDVRDRAFWAVAQGLANGDSKSVFRILLGLQTGQPINWRMLRTTLSWSPDELTDDDTDAMQNYLQWLSDELSLRPQVPPVVNERR